MPHLQLIAIVTRRSLMPHVHLERYRPPPEPDALPVLEPLEPVIDVARDPVVELLLEPITGALGSIGELLGSVALPDDAAPRGTMPGVGPAPGRLRALDAVSGISRRCRQLSNHFCLLRREMKSSKTASRLHSAARWLLACMELLVARTAPPGPTLVPMTIASAKARDFTMLNPRICLKAITASPQPRFRP